MKRKLNVDEIRKIQLSILNSLDRWCKDNGLHYTIAGGTLLGAVRHKGFIPWDDDIDVFMERKYYEVFCQKWDGPYDLVNNKIKGWISGITRIVDNGTILEWKEEHGEAENHGIWVSVIPIDKFPQDDEWVAFKKQLDLCYTLEKIKKIQWEDSVGILRNIIRCCVKILFLPVPNSYVRNRMNKTLQKYNKNEEYRNANVACWFASHRPNNRPQVFDNDCFDKYIRLEFEGNLYESMIGYDKYLTAVYGNYMQLPPVEQRVAPHEFNAYYK